MEISFIIRILDWLLFLIIGGTVLYMFRFALGALFYRNDRYAYAEKKGRFLILIPAYAEDRVIESTVMSAIDQDYPRKEFDVVVISDHMEEMTNFRLAQYPITLILPHFKEGESSKARSLNYAIKHMPNFKHYDMVVVLDADNMVNENFLTSLNNAWQAGIKIVQAHRISKNRNTPSALLDACFEEINNSIFRKGHVQKGYSSALVGSGIGFEYNWFRENVRRVFTSGEDKEFEALILQQGLFIEYLDDVIVYDEKTQKTKNFNTQRRRWMAAQLEALRNNILHLPKAIFTNQRDYADKIIQWMLIPRIILMGIIGLMCVVWPFFSGIAAIKWYLMGAFVLFIFAMCLPDYLVDKNFNKAVYAVPRIMFGALLNLFHLRGQSRKFLHTEHTIQNAPQQKTEKSKI